MTTISLLIVGLIAGWLAGLISRGKGFGIIGDLLVGVLGALVGGRVLGWFGIYSYGTIGSLAIAVVGAIIFLSIIRFVKTV